MKEIKIEVEDALYDRANKIYKLLGIDLDTAIQLFLKQSVYHRELPFKLKLPREPREPGDEDDPIIEDLF